MGSRSVDMAHRRHGSPSCQSPKRVTAKLLLSFLAVATPCIRPAAAIRVGSQRPILSPLDPGVSETQHIDLELRHIYHHGTYKYPNLLRKIDVPSSAQLWVKGRNEEDEPFYSRNLRVASKPITIQRLADRSPARMERLMAAGRERGAPLDLPSSAWTVDEIPGPDVSDKETVISFAQMCANAYVVDPDNQGWEDVGGGFNYTEDFGWETDGLRGHIFADTRNRTVVIGLKGTSPAVFDGTDTTTNDKINDNLFFSCCCGQGGSVLWRQVCDCMAETFTCNATCLIKSLREEDRYYYAAKQLYHNVTERYPDADVWLTGHSLGGAVSSLLGLTYGLPVTSFEAPGEALPAARLGLPTPPGYRIGRARPHSPTGGYHFGHTGDPVYMGNCMSCNIAGYAMESICHTGMECRYDTVKDKGFRNYIGNHKIAVVIHNVLEAYDEPAECVVIEDCTDCFNWKFFESHSSSGTASATTTSTSSYSRTRTQTCETPGWWGCLDETTTTTGTDSTTTTTSTSTTSTCETPGWFGCLDEVTTTTTTTTTSPTSKTENPSITSSSCKDPGWFGCRDPTTTTTTTQATSCETPGWFWCKDRTTTSTSSGTGYVPTATATPAPSITSATPTPTATTTACHRHWFFPGCWNAADRHIPEGL